MKDDEDSVTAKLLSPSSSKSESPTKMVLIENEKEKKSKASLEREPDLRLHDAVFEADVQRIKSVIEKSPELIFERDDDGRTPLHITAFTDAVAPQIAKVLLGLIESTDESHLISITRPDLLNLQDGFEYTVLHYAALNRHEKLLAALLKWGADPYVQDKNGNTALFLASQGVLDSAVRCGKLLLQADANKTLINIVNREGKTALHKAVDERSVLMCKFLLQPENKVDLSLQDSNGLNILHYICSGTDENEALCEIVTELIHRCNASQLNQQDNKKRTPLHYTAIQRLPQIMELLVNEDKTDVLRVDDSGKCALHYACQNGCYPKGHQCVDILIQRKFPEKVEVVKHLYRVEDSHGQTPFMYACLNCPPETVQRYMEVVKDPSYWLSGTYTTVLYKHCPLALTTLMDGAFTEDKTRSTDFHDDINVDYGTITGYSDTVEVSPQQETYYLKQALYWDYEPQKEVLLHPLVQLFMLRKWSKLRWIILAWVLWQFIWLGAFTTLVITFYSKNEDQHSEPLALVASLIMLLYILTSLVNEGFEIYTVKASYFFSLTNLTQLAQNLLALIAISPVIAGLAEPSTWQKYATAIGILFAYILSMRDIGKLHNKIGLVVEVLKQVLIQIVHVLLCCAPLWIGFTLGFIVIFDDEETLNSPFPGPLVKVLVMMTGEFEYNDTFKDEGDDGKSLPFLTLHKVVRLLFFLSFLISVPVAFFNLLTGFALDKVMELREKAKVGRIAKQLEHIHFIESILLSLRPLGKVLPFFRYDDFLRRMNVTTAWLDQKYKFFTVIREQIRRTDRRSNTNNRRVQGCFSELMPSFCADRVSSEVEEKIFALATKNSHPDLKEEKCPHCRK